MNVEQAFAKVAEIFPGRTAYVKETRWMKNGSWRKSSPREAALGICL